jgi:hypothetical protein
MGFGARRLGSTKGWGRNSSPDPESGEEGTRFFAESLPHSSPILPELRQIICSWDSSVTLPSSPDSQSESERIADSSFGPQVHCLCDSPFLIGFRIQVGADCGFGFGLSSYMCFLFFCK